MEIALCFFIYILKNLIYWPQILLCIQTIINNNFFLTVGKTPNKVAYDFTPRRFLDLLLALFSLDILATQAKAADAIFFTLLNQKML